MLVHHRCPVIEWKILLGAAEMASAYRRADLVEHYRGRCQQMIRELGESSSTRTFDAASWGRTRSGRRC